MTARAVLPLLEQQQVPDDPQGVPIRLAGEVNRHHDAVLNAERSGLHHAIEAGRLLARAKRLLGHGHFRRWLGTYCRCSVRTAGNYMVVAEWAATEANGQRAAHLSLRGVLLELRQQRPRGQRAAVPPEADPFELAAAIGRMVLSYRRRREGVAADVIERALQIVAAAARSADTLDAMCSYPQLGFEYTRAVVQAARDGEIAARGTTVYGLEDRSCPWNPRRHLAVRRRGPAYAAAGRLPRAEARLQMREAAVAALPEGFRALVREHAEARAEVMRTDAWGRPA